MSDDPFVEAALAVGMAAFGAEDYRTARAKFAEAQLRHPDDPRLRFWLAASHYHLGNVGEALKHLTSLAQGAPPLPGRPAAVFEYLCRCTMGSDPAKAVEYGLEGARLDPADARVRLVTGNALMRLGRHAAALEQFDEAWALERAPGGAPAFAAHPGQVPFARSHALAAMRQWADAREAVEDALARAPANAAYHNWRAVVLFDGLGDAAAALAPAEQAVALDPATTTSGSDGVYFFNLANILHRLGRSADALAAVERAIAISPQRDYRLLRERLRARSGGEAEGAGGTGDGAAAPSFTPAAEPAAARRRLTFADVGGMNGLKDQVRRVMNVVFGNRATAQRYGVVRNGILLYGPPGCGKTFFAEALAGEFNLAFVKVALGSAVSKYVGAAGETVEKLFADAKRRVPCLLFFDELDAIAVRRADTASGTEQQTVNALLQQIDAHRDTPGLVIAAATNRLDAIDPAVIREGRFDYKIKIYKPDFDARREILHVLLQPRPHDPAVDLARLAQDTEGFSAAQLRHVVDGAAMAALEAAAPIADGHLRRALEERAAEGRYGGPRLTWDDLCLPAETMRKLQFIERVIEHPDLVRELGVEPPTGVLLYGPPGTGKTTIARVLASQTDASFYAINAADVFSKWLGESEQHVKELFEQARDSVPALIFIDEIEAILGRRGEADSGGARAANAVVNTFLAEMDGIDPATRVFVVGATNRPDLVDEAAMRPGRLGELIEIGLPDTDGRLAMLTLFSGKMRLGASVDLAAIAAATEGASGADLRGLCTAAGRHALLRTLDAGEDAERAVTAEDFAAAEREVLPPLEWMDESQTRPIGFGRTE